MGTGDWNDGMNRVGREGRGESVWLGFFLHFVLGEFLPLCERRGDGERAARYRAYRAAVARALEEAGWDGAWYRRAYYDDGTPLGSAQNDECRIDALAQAWAVISGVASRARAEQAMDAVDRELVAERAGIVRLLWPPFDRTPHDPGYIKGYVPGIRENGGQYTHAALWVVRALAELGRRDRAVRLLEVLLPTAHARSAKRVAVYQVEPYVVAADVYGAPPHVGRGGWTWYTGSAGWTYRVMLESILGVTVEDGRELRVRPRIPDAWPGFTVTLRLADGRTRYEVEVVNPGRRAAGVASASVDGAAVRIEDGAARIALRADGALHRVRVTLG
jgi:cyclic beta-1,2-glucan synthetase